MVKKKILSGILSFMMMFGALSNFAPNYYVNAADTKAVLGVGQKEFGFTLAQKKKIDEIGATAYVFTHDKTGGKILFLKNEDKNRFFAINFKTPAKDNTGVNHIIEHSVLCGSKKYPAKDPFKIMMNQSVNTFLNAMTANDFTTYPIGSRNLKDYNNLVDIYLDAVFNPNFLTNKKIFEQEGWHYEINKNGDLNQNGTVLNEMKGYYGDPSELENIITAKTLLPDTDFVKDSGGNPDDITKLTYKKFVETYKKNYTPSNALVFAYGDVDMDALLKKIDTEYFSKYKKTSAPELKTAQKLSGKKKEAIFDYGVQLGSSTEKKTIFSYNYVVNSKLDKNTEIGLSFLNQLLFGSENSKLKIALTNAGLATQVSGGLDKIGPYTIYKIEISDGEYKDKAKIDKVVSDTLAQTVKEGFTKKQLDALFNSYEISYRESKFKGETVGLDYDQSILSSYLYGGDLLYYLTSNDACQAIKKQAQNKYFEKLLNNSIVKNKNLSEIVFKPVAGLAEKKNAESVSALKKQKAKMTNAQIKSINDEAKALLAWKSAPESKEAIASMPVLQKSDIEVNIVDTPTAIDNIDGIKVLNHPIAANGVAYANFYFDTSNLTAQEKMDLTIFSSIFNRLNTKTKQYTDLADEINMTTGGITAAPNVMTTAGSNYFVQQEVLSMSCLNDKIDPSMGLLNELINETKISDDPNRVKQIIKEDAISVALASSSLAPTFVELNVLPRISELYQMKSEGAGKDYLKYVLNMSKNAKFDWNNQLKRLEAIRKKVFNKNNLVISFTGDENEYNSFKKSLTKFTSSLSTEKTDKIQQEIKPSDEKNSAISTNDNVMFNFLGGNYEKAGYKYNPKMEVLSKILNSYLWDKIRTVGGAYGAQSIITNDGIAAFLSYNDPKLKETLDVFKGLPEYIKNYKCTDQELTNFIIGTVGNADNSSAVPSERGAVADELYFTDKTYDDLRKEYADILTTQLSDINGFADMLKAVIDQNCYCVSGSKDLITKNKDLFEQITTIDELLNK